MQCLCKICGEPFPPVNKAHKVCSEQCRMELRRRNSRDWARKHKKPQTYPDTRKCIICGHEFPVSNFTHVICSEECRKIKQAKYYKEYNRKHPPEKRPNKKVRPAYECRDVPIGKQWPCRNCGKMSHNRLTCPACLKKLTKGLNLEYQDIIFIDAGENITEKFEESIR